MRKPKLDDFINFNAYCRAMDRWMEYQWLELELEELLEEV